MVIVEKLLISDWSHYVSICIECIDSHLDSLQVRFPIQWRGKYLSWETCCVKEVRFRRKFRVVQTCDVYFAIAVLSRALRPYPASLIVAFSPASFSTARKTPSAPLTILHVEKGPIVQLNRHESHCSNVQCLRRKYNPYSRRRIYDGAATDAALDYFFFCYVKCKNDNIIMVIPLRTVTMRQPVGWIGRISRTTKLFRWW